MWVTEITLDGEALDLDEVLASLVIRHGRADVYDTANASTVQLTLKDQTRADTAPFRVGVPLTVAADGAPRFTGTVTDASLEDDLLTVIAVGLLATLNRYPVLLTDWPEEHWASRVARVFEEAGLSPLLSLMADSNFNPLLTARLAEDDLSLGDYLAELAEDVGAAIADTPDGMILVQQLTARQMRGGITWESMPPALAWEDCGSTSWTDADDLADVLPVLTVDPDDVLYVPTFVQALDLENETAVGYGDNLSVTAVEPPSVDRYGPYPGSVQTDLALEADATERAEQRVTRRAYPRWALPAAPILSGHPVQIGQVVELSDFPASSPFDSWRGVLEGWVDTIEGGTPEGTWTMELALSDPSYSGLALNWQDVPADLSWAEVSPACTWIDATILDALDPSYPGLLMEV